MKLNLVGQRFGSLVVLDFAERKNGNTRWLCECDCGTVKAIYDSTLRRSPYTSCGCQTKAALSKQFSQHGQARTGSGEKPSPEYRAWCGAKARCLNPSAQQYERYGGRGIGMCDEWLNDFSRFYRDMGARPHGHSLDRINVDGHYEPSNCRWATSKTQARNRRSNTTVAYKDRTVTIAELAETLSLDVARLGHLISRRGLNVEDAISECRKVSQT